MNIIEELKFLEEALEELSLAQIEVARHREALEMARASALLGGIITGKNAEEREAMARTSLTDEYSNLRLAEERLIRARAQAEIARARLEVAKLLKEEA